MLNMIDIFNISDVNDVPKTIQADLGLDQFAEEIIKLFQIANRPLTINEVFIAHYRMFSAQKNQNGQYQTKPDVTPKTKRQITLKLYNMSKDPEPTILSSGRGVYVLNTQKSSQLEFPI